MFDSRDNDMLAVMDTTENGKVTTQQNPDTETTHKSTELILIDLQVGNGAREHLNVSNVSSPSPAVLKRKTALTKQSLRGKHFSDILDSDDKITNQTVAPRTSHRMLNIPLGFD